MMAPASPADRSERPPGSVHRLGRWVLVGIVWLALLALPEWSGRVGLDDTWEQALGIFLRQRAQAGVDYIFTFGPLGYFFTGAYDPDLFWAKYAWEVVLKLAMALAFVMGLPRPREPGLEALRCILVVALLSAPVRWTRDTLYSLFVLAALLSLCRQPRLWRAAAVAVGLALLSHVKMSMFMAALVYVPACMTALAASRRLAAAVVLPVLFVAGWLGAWLALGQSPGNIAAYLHGAVEIVAGFNQAMALQDVPGHAIEVPLALTIAAMLAAVVITLDGRTLGVRAGGVVLLLTLFLEWKQGFTRHDGAHAVRFFLFTLFVPLLALPLLPARPAWIRTRRWLVLAVVVLSLTGYLVAKQNRASLPELTLRNAGRLFRNAVDVCTPWRLRQRLEVMRLAKTQEYSLPRLRAETGAGPADLLTSYSALLWMNGIRWDPRPVFQSYSAYTPSLLRANAAFLQSPRAPEYLVLWWVPLDTRLPASEDALALREILHRYRPVAVIEDEGLVIVRRQEAATTVQEEVLLERAVHFGEEVPLPPSAGRYQALAIQVRLSPWGRLRSLLYRPGPLSLVVTTSDSRKQAFRLIPALFEDGVLINPFLEADGDPLQLYGAPAPQVTSVRVRGSSSDGYDDRINIRLTALPELVTHPLTAEDLARLRKSR